MRRCGQLLQNAPRHVQHSQSARKFSAVLGTTSANSSCSTPGDEWWGGRWGREAGGVGGGVWGAGGGAWVVGLGEVCVCRRGAAPGSGGLLLPLLHVGGAVCSASGRSTSALAGGTAAATRRSLAPPHLPFPPPPRLTITIRPTGVLPADTCARGELGGGQLGRRRAPSRQALMACGAPGWWAARPVPPARSHRRRPAGGGRWGGISAGAEGEIAVAPRQRHPACLGVAHCDDRLVKLGVGWARLGF